MEKENLMEKEVKKESKEAIEELFKRVEEKPKKLEEELEKMQEPEKKKKLPIFIAVAAIFLIILLFSTIFALINLNQSNIASGVKIEGIDVSGLNLDEAKSKIEITYNEKKDNLIKLK